MIELIPSIFIRNGKLVRTIGSDIDKVEVYEQNPVDFIMNLEQHGLKRLHLIDIDGAEKRKFVNYQLLETILRYTKLKVDVSGGIANDDDVRTAFEFGASFVTSATVAVHDKKLFHDWMISYGGDKVILAADSLDGIVRTGGWKRRTGVDLIEHIEYYAERGIRYVKATEIGRNGTLEGPAFDLYKKLLERFPELKFLASGGVRSIEDIEKLQDMGVHGVIFGKSLFDGKIKLDDLKKFLN